MFHWPINDKEGICRTLEHGEPLWFDLKDFPAVVDLREKHEALLTDEPPSFREDGKGMFWDSSVPAFLLAVGMELLTTLIGEVAESWISRRDSTLRLCSYAPTDDVALEPHTDATFLTLQPIHSDQVSGLEGYWDNAWRPLNESGLLVYVGDFLEVITKGRYPALPHRIPFLRDARTSVVALLRGNNDAMIDTSGCPELASFDCTVRELRQFLDLYGRKRRREDQLWRVG